jgi:hypothetical protein
VKAKVTAAVLALGVAATLALPGTSPAATRHIREGASTDTEINLRGTHGYRISLFVAPRDVILSAFKVAGEKVETVDYFDDHDLSVGDPGNGIIDVKIGRLGRLRGDFVVSSKKSRAAERGCNAGPTLVEKGIFVGSFHFRGERGYTEVRADRAPGSVTRVAARNCVVHVPRRHPNPESADSDHKEGRKTGEWKLLAAGPRFAASLQAERRADRPQIGGEMLNLSASASQKVGNWNIGHYVSTFDFAAEPSTEFQVPDLAAPLAEAIIAPPTPFSGSATFRSGGERSGSWTGNLKVSLPGLGSVPLTGGGIEAGLCVGGVGCTDTLPSELQPILEAPPGAIVAVGVKR